MNVEEILTFLEREQVKVVVNNDNLSLTGEKSKLTPQILADIQKNKPAILSLLKSCSEPKEQESVGKKTYRCIDKSTYAIDQSDFDYLVGFVEMILSFTIREKKS